MPLYLSCGVENNNNLIQDIERVCKGVTQYHILLGREFNDGYKDIKEQFGKLSDIVELSISDFLLMKNISNDSLFLVYSNGKISASDLVNRLGLRNTLRSLIRRSESSKLIFIAFNNIVSITPQLSKNLLFSAAAKTVPGSKILQKIKNEQLKPFNHIRYLLTKNSFIKYSNNNLYYQGDIFKSKQNHWQQYIKNKFVDI